jgi:hypothetical protein
MNHIYSGQGIVLFIQNLIYPFVKFHTEQNGKYQTDHVLWPWVITMLTPFEENVKEHKTIYKHCFFARFISRLAASAQSEAREPPTEAETCMQGV